MSKSYIKIIIILSIMSLLLIINSFVSKIFNNIGIIIFLAISLLICIQSFGFRKTRKLYEKDVCLSIIIYVLSYYIVTYLLGLIFGFSKSIYDLSIVGIFSNVIPILFIIILSESIRYIINNKFKDNIKILIFSAIFFILVDTTFILRSIDYSSLKSIVDNFGLFIIPSITVNIMLTYVSCKFGYKVNILYRLLMEIPVYIVSIVPDFGNYIDSIISSCFPLLVFYLLYKNFNDSKKILKVDIGYKFKIKKIFCVIIIIFLIFLVILTSGLFKYKSIVIASGSMEPVIYRGDMVVVRKLNDKNKDNLEIGDIIVFNMDNKTVIHRIVSIIKSGNDIFYKTKGDNNNVVDNFLVEKDDIIGINVLTIRFVGYPSLWLSEI